ncbi:hypothetical protein J6590_009791 [Homalodisca vitripennis]|nr:hypothetical protein J6590_009791 [Homalodisca vitripennis]
MVHFGICRMRKSNGRGWQQVQHILGRPHGRCSRLHSVAKTNMSGGSDLSRNPCFFMNNLIENIQMRDAQVDICIESESMSGKILLSGGRKFIRHLEPVISDTSARNSAATRIDREMAAVRLSGVTMQGMVPQPVPLTQDLSASKRRKKRRRRRRGGVTEDGSESSCCEEPLTCDVTGCQSETGSDAVCQSGASSDGGVSSKANSDSGINTDPTPNSGSNSPPLLSQVPYHPPEEQLSADCVTYQNQGLPLSTSGENIQEDSSLTEVTTPEEVTEELSTAEDDVTPNLCAAAPEFSSQESTLSCLSTPSATKEFIVNESEVSNAEISHEVFESCQSITEPLAGEDISLSEDIFCKDLEGQSSTALVSNSDITDGDLKTTLKKNTENDENKVVNPESNGINVGDEIKEICYEEVKISEVSELQTNISLELIQPIEIIETFVSSEEEKETELLNNCEIDVRNEAMEPQCIASTSTNNDTAIISECEQSFSRFSSCRESIAPVPPPRRKRSMSRAADKLASRIVEEAINEGIEEACERLRSPMSITEAVTRWLNSQGSSPLTCPITDSESGSDDEGIEVEDGLTDQKNVRGNPFLVSSHSGTGQRVAKDCESLESSAGEWDMWDHSHTRDMCDPTRSVDRYYRLGADDSPPRGDRDKVPPSVYKTAMHIRHTGPFPCGVCCIIQ